MKNSRISFLELFLNVGSGREVFRMNFINYDRKQKEVESVKNYEKKRKSRLFDNWL